ncbi:DMT family transporter [Sphingosinicellaceae bacterium]|nr:DMT family transporter [Sphingosinicellaceae bacterium]
MNAEHQPITAGPNKRRVHPATIVQFVLLSLIWGSTWLVIKGQLGVVPPAWSVSYRFLIASVVVVLMCVVLRRPLRMGPAGHALAVAAGSVQFLLNFNLVYAAETYVTSGLVALVFSLIVVPNTLLARVFLGQRIAPLFVVGSVMGIAGVALLVGHDLDVRGADVGIGLALAAGAVLGASVANVIQGSARARALPLEGLIAAAMLYGGLMSAAWAWASSGPPVVELRWTYAAGVTYLAVVASALAFRLYYALIREIGPARAGYVNVIVPVVAMTLSTVFEGFVWTWGAGLGVVLALSGLVVALRSRA